MNNRIFITLFTSTYNRAKLLNRLYESIRRQNFSNFEWIIVDDGSTDNTSQIVESWIKESNFDIRYFYQENSGKHIAINRGVKEARGELFFIVDSDDWLADNSLIDVWEIWNSIPERDKSHFMGISGLCAYKDGRIVGDRYPFDLMDSNYIERRAFYNIKGDKCDIFKTEVLRQFPFPDNLGKFVTEALVWNRIAQKYKMRFVNRIWLYVEYLPDGLTNKRIKIALENSGSVILYCKEFFTIKNRKVRFRYKLRNTITYARFSMHKKEFLKNLISLNSIELRLLYFVVSPVAFLLYLRDRLILRE